MKIGVVKERKDQERRVGLTPAGCGLLIGRGHELLVESGAGVGSGFADVDYEAAGAAIRPAAEEIFAESEMIVKVKEPLPDEYGQLRSGQTVFAYLHLAAAPQLRQALENSGANAFAYELVRESDGTMPLLAPMSEIAGRMSVQIAARLLEQSAGGPGIMLAGVPGVAPARVAIVGGGIVGANAARIALGMGANVTILDMNPSRLRQLDQMFAGVATTLMSNEFNVSDSVVAADVVIGAVLIPGRAAPRIVTREMVARMKPGSVIIDVAVDQGGCVETVDRVTSHSNPTYQVDGVIHYAVPNIPGIVPRTATLALTNATLPYIAELADKGWRAAVDGGGALSRAASIIQGRQAAGF